MLFLFFSTLCEWGGWVLKSVENSTLFFKPPLIHIYGKYCQQKYMDLSCAWANGWMIHFPTSTRSHFLDGVFRRLPLDLESWNFFWYALTLCLTKCSIPLWLVWFGLVWSGIWSWFWKMAVLKKAVQKFLIFLA